MIDQTGSRDTSRIAHALPRFRFEGVDSTILSQLTTLMHTNWPGYDWNAALNAQCTVSNIGELQCTIPMK